MRTILKTTLCGLLLVATMASCSTKKLLIPSVGYQSVRTNYAQPTQIPSTAKIAVQYFINPQGEVFGVVYNLTDEIMTIDQTKSFMVTTEGNSLSYYDPNVYTTTEGKYNSATQSSSFNLGAIANAFGIVGKLGSLLSGTTLGSSTTVGSMTQNSVAVTDQPQVRIGPHGKMALSKQFASGVGKSRMASTTQSFSRENSKTSPLKFSICVNYSLGEDGPAKKLVTNFYVNDNIVVPVKDWKVDDSLRSIYKQKPDAVAENSFIISINTNIEETASSIWAAGYEEIKNKVISTYQKGSLIDYQ